MKHIPVFLFLTAFLWGCESTKKNNAKVADSNQLEGTWELTYILSPGTSFEKLYPGSRPFIRFDVANKRMNGKTGCNNFSGALVTKDSIIDFSGPIAMTKMYCAGDGESVFTKTLTRIRSYKLEDTVLTFISGGETLMRFNKKMP